MMVSIMVLVMILLIIEIVVIVVMMMGRQPGSPIYKVGERKRIDIFCEGDIITNTNK
jgi:hypothetical protein